MGMQFKIEKTVLNDRMKFAFIVILLASLISCDVPGMIYVHNQSGDEASFLIQKTDTLNNLSIARIADGKSSFFFFGFGQYWNNQRLMHFIDDVEFMEIRTSKDTIKISDHSDLYSFFKQRRGGIFNSKLEIGIK